MSYIDDIAEKIRASVSRRKGRPTTSPEPLLRNYAVLALVTGGKTTMENIHDAWAAWRAEAQPDHPDLVPFWDLPEDRRFLDLTYLEAVHEVAAGL